MRFRCPAPNCDGYFPRKSNCIQHILRAHPEIDRNGPEDFNIVKYRFNDQNILEEEPEKQAKKQQKNNQRFQSDIQSVVNNLDRYIPVNAEPSSHE